MSTVLVTVFPKIIFKYLFPEVGIKAAEVHKKELLINDIIVSYRLN